MSTSSRVRTIILVTLVLGAVAVWLGGTARPDQVPVARKHERHAPPALSTDVPRLPTQEEITLRSAKLAVTTNSALDRVLPPGWDHAVFTYSCDTIHCWSMSVMLSASNLGINLKIEISPDFAVKSCYRPICTKRLLDDGTLVALRDEPDITDPGRSPESCRGINLLRPDGTTIDLVPCWPLGRPIPLPEDQWIGFATMLTY